MWLSMALHPKYILHRRKLSHRFVVLVVQNMNQSDWLMMQRCILELEFFLYEVLILVNGLISNFLQLEKQQRAYIRLVKKFACNIIIGM